MTSPVSGSGTGGRRPPSSSKGGLRELALGDTAGTIQALTAFDGTPHVPGGER